MIFAEEPYTLHLLAGSNTITALDAIKSLLDDGQHNVNEREKDDNLTSLHVAAHWDNLAVCQLLLHYGAEINAIDAGGRRPIDMATGRSRRFLKKYRKKDPREKSRFRKVLSSLFHRVCLRRSSINNLNATHNDSSILQCSDRSSCPNISTCKIAQKHMPFQYEFPIDKSNQNTISFEAHFDQKEDSIELPRRNRNCTMEFVSPNVTINEYLLPDNIMDMGPEKCVNHADDPKLKALQGKFSKLTIESLCNSLKHSGLEVGPVNARNRKLYELKLAKFKLGLTDGGMNSQKPRYSHSLVQLISHLENGFDRITIGINEDKAINAQYSSSLKNEVSYFCYLLIDPLISNTDNSQPTMRQFISAIFYIGKGKRSRPLQHLIHAYRCRSVSDKIELSKKLKRILDLWDKGLGVISLNIFSNIPSAEAYNREAAMIDAIGVCNLTNIQRGTFSGITKSWNSKQITDFGAFLLYKSYVIFLNERCRPILEDDIALMRT